MNQNWVKYPVSLGTDLKTGSLTRDEFLLLSYMLSQCDRNTGIIVTNSRLLSIEIDQDRKRVSNVLTALKKKGRVRNPDGSQLSLRQKKGNTKPYSILLCDALPNNVLDRDKTEGRQKQDRGKTDGVDRRNEPEPPEPAETLTESKSGKFLAQRDLDLDLDQTPPNPQDVPTTVKSKPDEDQVELVSLRKLMHKKWPYPNPPNEAVLERMIDKYTLSVCTDAMDATPAVMDNLKWDSIYTYMRKVAENIKPKEEFTRGTEEQIAINTMKQTVRQLGSIDPETGYSPGMLTRFSAINTMRPYRKWYDEVDDFGEQIKMSLEEYDELMEGDD